MSAKCCDMNYGSRLLRTRTPYHSDNCLPRSATNCACSCANGIAKCIAGIRILAIEGTMRSAAEIAC